jgi:mersacidin/lichenicidin family type 2 lantibiotic
MSNEDIIRAWKDEEFRNSLSEEQRSQFPENPAGIIELSDADMESVAGGWGSYLACGGGVKISQNGCNNSFQGNCNHNSAGNCGGGVSIGGNCNSFAGGNCK